MYFIFTLKKNQINHCSTLSLSFLHIFCKCFCNHSIAFCQPQLPLSNHKKTFTRIMIVYDDRVLSTLVYLRNQGLSWDFFFSQGKPKKPGNVMDFFMKARKFFKLIILISYLPIVILDKTLKSLR